MPTVGRKKFGYSKKGKAAAKKHAKKTGKRVVSSKPKSAAKRTGRRVMVGAAAKRRK
tara:strand:- start:10785 stop:10955 length:171 start_codon:yes stop_codon:yes gene_type:complete